MIKCKNCGKVIDKISLNVFLSDGTDMEFDYQLNECEEASSVYIDTDKNWTAYELSEDEQREHITCPHCGKFPFANNEVQIYEIVRIVCFKE